MKNSNEDVTQQQKKHTPIVWIDCEMTGLNLDIDELVEIAVVITDADLQPLDRGLQLVIKPSADAVAQMNEFVQKMHTTTGLIDEWENGLSVSEAEARVLEYVKKFVPDAKKAQLGGNSVGTDKNFLAKYMPNLIDHLHYRIIDVSSIKELAKRWYPRTYFSAPEKTGNHRALGDIYDSIDELRYYRAALFPAGDGLDVAQAAEVAASIEPTSKKFN
ncbi:MAG: oligoribonuclease [Arcanobacterium sp.]|nr:oligoribonuclease [Arcanobacterium sp.]